MRVRRNYLHVGFESSWIGENYTLIPEWHRDRIQQKYGMPIEAWEAKTGKKLEEMSRTRLGVFDGDKLVGWVTLTDVARAPSRKNLLDNILGRDKPEAPEVVCPRCKAGILKATSRREGGFFVWECSNCSYVE